MNIRKLPSGKWNVRVYVGRDANGKIKHKSITAETKQEAIRQAALYDMSVSEDMNVAKMVERYIETKRAVLSPSTYRGYSAIYNTKIKTSTFGACKISVLTSQKVQRWISDISRDHSPKSVKNAYGVFTAALDMFAPGKRFSVQLPQPRKADLHTPSTDEVNKVIEIARKKNPELYKAILLGAIGMMRRGEIAALTQDDLDFKNNTIRINKAQVKNIDNEYETKAPKTYASNRTVVMPKFVMDALPREGKPVNLKTSHITDRFRRLMENSGLPHFRFHDLRHYAASIAASSSIGASLEAIKARGGWATDSMMKRVYINQISDEVAKDTKAINDYFTKKIK